MNKQKLIKKIKEKYGMMQYMNVLNKIIRDLLILILEDKTNIKTSFPDYKTKMESISDLVYDSETYGADNIEMSFLSNGIACDVCIRKNYWSYVDIVTVRFLLFRADGRADSDQITCTNRKRMVDEDRYLEEFDILFDVFDDRVTELDDNNKYLTQYIMSLDI